MTGQTAIATIYLVLGIILFLLGLMILKENFKSRLNRTTGLMLFFAAAGALFAAVGTGIMPLDQNLSRRIQTSLVYNLFYFWELFFPQLILFSLVFPVERPFIRRFPRTRYFFYVPHLFHFLLVAFFSNPHRLEQVFTSPDMAAPFRGILQSLSYVGKLGDAFFGVLYQAHVRLFSLVNLAYIVVAIWLLNVGFQEVTNPRLKQQVRFIIWGIRLAVGLYAVAFLLPALSGIFILGEAPRQALTIGALVIGSGSIAWGIIRYQFMDVKLLVRQSLAYSLTSALVVGLYLTLVNQFGRMVKNVFGQRIPLLDVGFIAIALILFQPLFGQIDDLIKRWFIKGSSDFRNLMARFTREIITILDPQELRRTVLDVLEKELLIMNVLLGVYRPKQNDYHIAGRLANRNPYHSESFVSVRPRLIGEYPEGGTSFPADDLLLRQLTQAQKPIHFEILESEAQKTPLGAFFKSEKIRIVVPLIDQERLQGFLALSDKISGYRYSSEDLTLLGVLANQLTVAMTNAQLYIEHLEKQRLEEELSLARQIQFDLLPKFNPRGQEYEFASYCQPSRQVGGDFYDFLLKEDKVGLIVADASGKGIPAALLVSLLQATLKAEYRHNRPLAEMISNVNLLIASSTSAEKFISMFYGEFCPSKKSLLYSNAGHNYPILLHSDGSFEQLAEGGLLMGIFANSVYQTAKVDLHKNDTLICYTDGVIDAQNPRAQDFGEQRLLEVARAHRHLPADSLKNKIVEVVNNFTEGLPQFDDLTVVVLKVY